MKMRVVAGMFLAAAALAWTAPAANAQLVQGDFTFQFADPTTGLPLTNLVIPTVGGTAKVAVYLIQTAGTPSNVLQQFGAEGLGVRLNYASPVGIVKVPTTGAANITARPPPAFNPNAVPSDYDIIQRTGTGTGTDTTLSAAISEGLFDPTDPLPFPGPEDPLGNKLRMLIGTFNFQGLMGGTESVTAVTLSAGSVNNLTGPDPVITGARNDGTTGPVPGNGSQGEIALDQFLSSTAPVLSITVVPEPGTLALGSLAMVGLAAWRRRKTVASVAA